MKKNIILIIALMISTTSINAASNSMDSYIQDKTSSKAYTSEHTDNWKYASFKGADFKKDLYTLKSLGKSLLKNPKHFDAFMYITEHHIMGSFSISMDIEYPNPNQIADMGNKVLGILNNLDSFSVENKVAIYDINYDVWTKSNTKNYKNNTALISAFLEGKVLSRKNLGAAPFKAKMFTH